MSGIIWRDTREDTGQMDDQSRAYDGRFTENGEDADGEGLLDLDVSIDL